MGNVGIFNSSSFRVYKTDTMSDLRYDTRLGYITQFNTPDGTVYIKVNKENFAEGEKEQYTWFGYCKKEKFLEYLVLKINKDEKKYYFDELLKHFYNDFKNAEDDDTLTTIRLNYEPSPSSIFCQLYSYKWKYKKDYDLTDEIGNIIIPEENYPGFSKVPYTMPTELAASTFFSHKYQIYVSNLVDTNEKKEKTYWLIHIGLAIHWINEDIFSIFSQNGFLTQYIENQNNEWKSLLIFDNPTVETLQEYYDRLKDFHKTSFSNQKFIISSKDEIKLYWLAHVLSPEALSIVPVEDKIKLLRYIAKGSIKGETSHFFGEINEEEFVLKIITSITNINSQINLFLNYLNSIFYEGKKQETTLFELLYNKVNDAGIGNENLKKLMDLLYQKWLLSSFYLYNLDGTVKDNLINPDTYSSKPIYVDYKASQILWIFNSTNYDFDFNSRKIEIKTDFKIEGSPTTIEKIVGTYSIYQAVTVKNTDENTENIKFITIGSGDDKKAVMPIFYLKYIDDKKSTENLETALELTFDLALTFSGIGNLAKLRHLKHLTPFGRVALLLDAPGANLIRYELAQGVAGLIEVSSTVADILLTYGDDNYINTYCTVGSSTYDQQKCEFYTRLNLLVNVLQIFSGALDYVTSRQLRNASKKLLDSPIPPNFDSEVLLLLQKFAGNTTEITNVFRAKLINSFGNNSQIINKLDNLPISPINKQEMFILDFERASDDFLQSLNNNQVLIDRWNSLATYGLVTERKLISFLNKQLHVETIIKFYSKSNLKPILEKISYTIRIKFLDEFKILTDAQINKIAQKPNKLELILSYQKKNKIGHADELLQSDVIRIVESNLSDIQVALLKIKAETILKIAASRYLRDIIKINIPISRLSAIQNGEASIFPFFSSLTDDAKKIFISSNKLFADVQIYNGNTPIGNIIKENYLSGRRPDVFEVSSTFFKEPTNYDNFSIFKKKAKQTVPQVGRNRENDTELKFIFNFLEEHWDNGNRFVINLESTLYACQSCQGYLAYLKQLAKENGKTLEITFKANKEIESIDDLNNLIN